MTFPQRSSRGFQALSTVLTFACVALVVWLTYSPGLRGPFVFDDIPNFISNPAVAVSELTSSQIGAAARANDSGPLGRPLSSLSFGLNHFLAGGYENTFPFKLTNLLIHIVNIVLVYWLARSLLSKLPACDWPLPSEMRLPLAAFAAVAWGLHPIQLTSVLYVVQRMTTLSAMFTLAGLLLFFAGRKRVELGVPRGFRLMAAGLLVGLAGALAKENAVLILAYVLVIEFVFFNRPLSTADQRHLAAFYGVSVFAPFTISVAALTFHPSWLLDTYIVRDFTLIERLLTEARVLWRYASLIVFPQPAGFTLFHDDIPLSTGLLTPWSTFPAVVALLAALASSILLTKRAPVAAFAVLWFLAGHSLESSIFGLELAHEHRNYLPSFGLIFAIACVIGRYHASTTYKAVPVSMAAAFVLTLGVVTSIRAETWSSEERLIQTMVQQHPRSERSHAMYAELLGERRGDMKGAFQHYRQAMELAPEEPAYALRLILFVAAHFQPSSHAATAENRATVWRALEATLGDRLIIQLATGPISPEGARSLRAVNRCVIEKLGTCNQLVPDVIGWHKALEQNPRALPSIRSSLLFDLFEIAYADARYDTALWAAQRGSTLDPSSIDFLLMQADALVALKRLSEAERALAQIEAKSEHAPGRHVSIEIIRKKIRAQRTRVSKLGGAT